MMDSVQLRARRNTKLASCDWTQLPDAPISEQLKADYRIYRQQLRDLPQNVNDLNNIQWPTPPQ